LAYYYHLKKSDLYLPKLEIVWMVPISFSHVSDEKAAPCNKNKTCPEGVEFSPGSENL